MYPVPDYRKDWSWYQDQWSRHKKRRSQKRRRRNLHRGSAYKVASRAFKEGPKPGHIPDETCRSYGISPYQVSRPVSSRSLLEKKRMLVMRMELVLSSRTTGKFPIIPVPRKLGPLSARLRALALRYFRRGLSSPVIRTRTRLPARVEAFTPEDGSSYLDSKYDWESIPIDLIDLNE